MGSLEGDINNLPALQGSTYDCLHCKQKRLTTLELTSSPMATHVYSKLSNNYAPRTNTTTHPPLGALLLLGRLPPLPATGSLSVSPATTGTDQGTLPVALDGPL